ncbi:MAG: RNA-guided endonuclease InsQ/TnpB family protein [Thermoplasmatota archaeon]
MKSIKTYKFKIKEPNQGKAYKMNQTVRQYRCCINFYLHRIQENSVWYIKEEEKGEDKIKFYREGLRDIYNKARELFDLPAALVQTARDFSKEQFKSWKNNEDNRRYPHFDSFVAVRYDKRILSFKLSGGHFQLWANIATNEGRVRVPLTSCENYMSVLTDNMERFQSAHLIFRDGEFYLNVIFQEDKKITKEDKFEHFIGVDMGIKNLATVVVQDREGNVLESQFFSGGKLQEKRRRFRERRRELGEKKLWSKLKETKDRESNYIEDMNHKISRKIVDIAKKYDNSVVVMEKLDGIRKNTDNSKQHNWKLHNWPFGQLQDFITYKAHNSSIAVRRVHPAYTSQVCRDCFGKTERVSQARAVCQSCKKEYNADWLGASNIVKRLFGYMSDDLGSSDYCPEHGSEEPKGVTGSTFGLTKGFVARLRVS